MAGVYRDRGRLAESKALLERALAIREKVLGPNHGFTKATPDALESLRV
ncbi:MAG TPA: tetratricopeptide repeat protein [Candidatus Tumulicola sp.]